MATAASANTWQDGYYTVYNNKAGDTITLDTFYQGHKVWDSAGVPVKLNVTKIHGATFQRWYIPNGGKPTSHDFKGKDPMKIDIKKGTATNHVFRTSTGGFQAAYLFKVTVEDVVWEKSCKEHVTYHCDNKQENGHGTKGHKPECKDDTPCRKRIFPRDVEVPVYFNIGWGLEVYTDDDKPEPPVKSPGKPGDKPKPGKPDSPKDPVKSPDEKPKPGPGKDDEPSKPEPPAKPDGPGSQDGPRRSEDISNDQTPQGEIIISDDITSGDIYIDVTTEGGGCNAAAAGVVLLGFTIGFGLYMLSQRKR